MKTIEEQFEESRQKLRRAMDLKARENVHEIEYSRAYLKMSKHGTAPKLKRKYHAF